MYQNLNKNDDITNIIYALFFTFLIDNDDSVLFGRGKQKAVRMRRIVQYCMLYKKGYQSCTNGG